MSESEPKEWSVLLREYLQMLRAKGELDVENELTHASLNVINAMDEEIRRISGVVLNLIDIQKESDREALELITKLDSSGSDLIHKNLILTKEKYDLSNRLLESSSDQLNTTEIAVEKINNLWGDKVKLMVNLNEAKAPQVKGGRRSPKYEKYEKIILEVMAEYTSSENQLKTKDTKLTSSKAMELIDRQIGNGECIESSVFFSWLNKYKINKGKNIFTRANEKD